MMLKPEIEPRIMGFDRIMAGVEVDEIILAKLRQRYIDEFPWTQGTTQIEQMFQDFLGGQPWGWEWHRLWREKFERLGFFPAMWTTISRIRAKSIREIGSYDHRIYLLKHTVWSAGTVERELSSSFQREFCWFSVPLTDEPSVIQDLEQDLVHAYATGKGVAESPPFYPGSRLGFHSGQLTEEYKHLGRECRVRQRS
jgi:hypothetical protein